MEPFLTLSAVSAGLLGYGALRGRPLSRWWVPSLRGGLAAMFLLTGSAHFVGLRAELISMVPAGLPWPGAMVTVTGVLELAGAIGLLWSRTAVPAAAGLGALLLAVFPANVHAATDGRALAWSDQLVPRTILQVVFLTATVAVVWGLRSTRRLVDPAPVVTQ